MPPLYSQPNKPAAQSTKHQNDENIVQEPVFLGRAGRGMAGELKNRSSCRRCL
ncbi:hypothetical protein BDW68DRAFT_170130 [Aspergillus falconensis]